MSSNITQEVIVTPLRKNVQNLLPIICDGNWYWKMETLQLWGSFKARGVISQMEHRMDEIQSYKGVVAISTGNYGFAMGQYCKKAGILCTILAPSDITENKYRRLKSTGAIVKKIPIQEMITEVETLQNAGHIFMRIDDPFAIMAYGSIVNEIIQQMGFAPDIIMVPVGSGSFLAGISKAVKEMFLHTIVIGLEPDYCPMMYRSFQIGYLSVEHASYLGVLGAKYMCGQSFPICFQNGATVLQVRNDDITHAIRQLDSIGVSVDPLAAQIAAVMQNDTLHYMDLRGKTIVGIITG